MSDDVIQLNEIGKIGTVKVYNQAYVDKQQKRIAELEQKLENIRYYLDNEIPLEFINEATTIIYKMV